MSPRPPQADEPQPSEGQPGQPQPGQPQPGQPQPQPGQPQPGQPQPSEGQPSEGLGAALSGLPVPDHGPTFWADLTDRLSDEPTVAPAPVRAQVETTVPNRTGSAIDAGPATDPTEPAPASLDDRRARRAARRAGGRLPRSLGAAAAAVALVVAAAGALTVVNRDDDRDSQVRAADRPSGTAKHDKDKGTPSTPAAPAEFSATYSGVDGIHGSDECPPKSPGAVCRDWRLTVARDGSFRWTSTDGSDDMAFDVATGVGRHVEIVSAGPGASKTRPNAFVSTGVPAGGPDQRVAKPEPLGAMADFVAALARAGDPRITATTVAGRAAWHYDGPTVQDRLGGDGAPDHAVADVDQASGVLLQLTRRVGSSVVTRFTAADVTTSDQIDRARYRIDPPPGAKTNSFSIGFVLKTLDEAGTGLPYDLLVPGQVPDGFTLESVSVDRDVASSTGPEGMNPPVKNIVAMTWHNGAHRFTVTLRPTNSEQWDDPFRPEGLVLDAQPVRLELPGRAPLEGTVSVDAPVVPHLWGITGDVVVTVSGDLHRAELERVAGSLRPHRAG